MTVHFGTQTFSPRTGDATPLYQISRDDQLRNYTVRRLIKGEDQKVQTETYTLQNTFRKWACTNPAVEVADPDNRWSLIALEKQRQSANTTAGYALLTVMGSIVLLAARLFKWLNRGHWAVYSAVAFVAFIIFAGAVTRYYNCGFHIANRIVSVVELIRDPKIETKEITDQTALTLKAAAYGYKELN
jgi:hypothetical protein